MTLHARRIVGFRVVNRAKALARGTAAALVGLAFPLGGCGDDAPDESDSGVTSGCSVTETEAGARIRCDDGTEVTVTHGEQGPRGGEGPGGDAGEPGVDGMDGTDCQVTQEGEGAIIRCGDGSSVTLAPLPGPAGPAGEDARSSSAGLRLALTEVEVADDRHVTVTVSVTDAEGVGLDRLGQVTDGAVQPRFTLAHLRADGAGFDSDILTEQTSPITNATANLPHYDNAGEWSDVEGMPGVYRYRFSEPLPEDYDPTTTYRVATWATRTLGDVRYAHDAFIDFRPDGDAALERREISTTETCNTCHNPLALHGSQRLSMELCVSCHTPQDVDPDTGSSIDMRVMIHKIHMGHSLPSVMAGQPYQIVGFRQSVHDYSDVAFPHEENHCPTCHTGSDGMAWAENPSKEACGSCHDDVDFALAFPDPDPNDDIVPHPGGPARDNASCTTCHAVDGLPGVSVQESHQRGKLNPNTPTLTVEILSVSDTAPGEQPTVRFSVKEDDSPRDLIAAPLDSLRFVVAGPTTGITGSVSYTVSDPGTQLTAEATAGEFSYTLPDTVAEAAARLSPVPAPAAGSFGIMAEGRHTFVDIARPDGTMEDVRVGFANPAYYFAVTDTGPVARRQVVSNDKCNACHREMAFHGDNRSTVESCAFCHNATQDTLGRMPTPSAGMTVETTSVRFGPMIHRIHGSAIASEPYTLYGFTGNPVDFSSIPFPAAAEDCQMCHLAGTYDLPLPDLPATATRLKDETGAPAGVADTLQATAANCVGCHDGQAVRAHADLATTTAGAESCATCHAFGSAFGVDVVHARPQWEE